MSRRPRFEPTPETRPRPPRRPQPRVSAAARRRRLRRARRAIDAFAAVNRYQSQLQGVALAMIAYMDQHWCGPGRGHDFDRWWCYIAYYARALRAPKLADKNNRVAREALERILDRNQIPPSKL